MNSIRKPIANPDLVLREEFDDWAVLFDPDSGSGYGLSPVSVFIWNRLDGRTTPAEILADLRAHFDDVPDNAEAEVTEFIDDLARRGFVGYEVPLSGQR